MTSQIKVYQDAIFIEIASFQVNFLTIKMVKYIKVSLLTVNSMNI